MWCDLPVTHDAPNGKTHADPHWMNLAAYGDSVGSDYDAMYPASGLDTAAAVDFIATLAEARPERSVLEFGIGTGRLAIGLHMRGLQVAGVDASRSMVAELRSKAPTAPIQIAIGDYASAGFDRAFAVVALVFNNILDERGTAAQLRVFANAAAHLAAGGCFVVEAFVLSDEARDGSWNVVPRYVGDEHVELQMARFDVETSTLERTLVHLRPEGPRFLSVKDVYAGPGELDVMAHVNGMKRIARYADWSRSPFTAHSRRHITVYQRD